MSFVPRQYRLGDHVRITRDLANSEGTFSSGHEFVIIDAHVRNGAFIYDLRDRELNVLGDVSPEYLARTSNLD